MSEEWRVGKGYHWRSETCSGYAVDNLDTKELSDLKEGSDIFETLFILTREALESYEGLDRGFEGDSLDVCHHISRYISQNRRHLL
jgi:hypothetical protein